jgi:hypothetical protein
MKQNQDDDVVSTIRTLMSQRLSKIPTESFQFSNDPLLIQKVRDIAGLYFDPPHHAPYTAHFEFNAKSP